VDGLHTRVLLRCGECETWQDLVLGRGKARALQRRLRRDERRMARALRELERVGAELAHLTHGHTG
jgi:hypothetical protein